MTRTAAATRPPMRETPTDKRTTSASPERVEICRLLAQLAVKPEPGENSEVAAYRFDSWSQPGGLYAGDARYLQRLPDDRLAWWSCTAMGCRSVAEVEQTVLGVLRARAGGVG